MPVKVLANAKCVILQNPIFGKIIHFGIKKKLRCKKTQFEGAVLGGIICVLSTQYITMIDVSKNQIDTFQEHLTFSEIFKLDEKMIMENFAKFYFVEF